MRFALLVCLKDLRQRLRDRTAILVAVIVPLLLSALVGLALGGNSAGFQLRLAWVDLDPSEASQALRQFMTRPWLEDVVLIQDAASEEHAAQLLDDRDADAALILMPDFARHSAERRGVEVLASGNNRFATRMVVTLVERFLTVRNAGAAIQGKARENVQEIQPISPGGSIRIVDAYAFSMTVLFLTFTVLSGVRSMQQEVETGAIARLAASPASARTILAGKLLGLLLTGLLQMTVMIAATSLLFGTDWGNPVAVACLVLSTVCMAIGLTSFFMAIASNADQGYALASISIFLLAVVGGQFMPPQGLPDVFETLQRLTPNGQAARGFMDAAALGNTGGVGNLLEPLAFTLGVGVLGIAFAASRAGDAVQGSAR